MKKISPNNNAPDSPLRKVFIAGLVLAVIIAWGMLIFTLLLGKVPGRTDKAGEGGFARELKNYDLLDPVKLALEGENPEITEKRLSRLQKQAGGAEENLSVLKRRRMLALADRRLIPGYAKAAKEAAAAFPYSAPLAAVAAEAVIQEDLLSAGAAISGSSSLLDTYARRISQSRFGPLELCLHILAGNLEDPARAAGIAGIENLLSAYLADAETNMQEQSAEELRTDEFLLLAYKNDARGAANKLNAILSSPDIARQNVVRMGAEFFYDYNNPLRAAELFLRLGGEKDIARAADSMVLAGEISGARNIWLALSALYAIRDTGGRTDALASPYGNREAGSLTEASVYGNTAAREYSGRILYNLAASSPYRDEEKSWLERIFQGQSQLQRIQGRQSALDIAETFSVIRYTRLLDTLGSIAVLENDDMRKNTLLDLELLRRRMETLPPLRATAEVWMLLNRHSGEEILYEWAAWYFDYQKLYEETARVIKEAERKNMSGAWLDLHRSLALIREGKTTEGEKLLKEAYLKNAYAKGESTDSREIAAVDLNWRIPANLGRIQESRRAIASALEYYEAAAALVKENKAAAQIQLRISRCLAALGQSRESRRAMETALELDPEDINIRRELRRSGGL